jgi:4-amino-4-deoxychorismate lyase
MRFIETLLIKDKIENLIYHNIRMNTTRAIFFGKEPIDLKYFVDIKQNTRCRVLYSEDILKVEYFDLKPREFKKLKVVYSDIEYDFKYENREKLNSLKVDGYDEVVIVKDGYITDTTISNLAFFDGKEWVTPNTPLLEGTKRMELLDKGFLREKEIKIDDLKNYKKIAMMNAIIGFYEIGEIESSIEI